MDRSQPKHMAAQHALEYIQSGMVLGLGTGTTVAHFLSLLSERLRSGELRNISGVPTSDDTARRAREFGIPLTSLAEYEYLDLAVDGADQVDPNLNLIKGLGRALLREKIVVVHARSFLVIADSSKHAGVLGAGVPLPVEIIPFQWEAHVRWLNTLGCRAELWREEGGAPATSDNGNYFALCRFEEGITDPYAIALLLERRPGIVEHGLFLDMADRVVLASSSGVRVLEREP